MDSSTKELVREWWTNRMQSEANIELEAGFPGLKKTLGSMMLATVAVLMDEAKESSGRNLLSLLQARSVRPLRDVESRRLDEFVLKAATRCAFVQADLNREGLFPGKAKRSQIRNAILAKCGSLLGQVDSSRDRRTEWVHVRSISSIVLETWCDTGGTYQLSVWHDMKLPNGATILRSVSPANLIGLGAIDCDIVNGDNDLVDLFRYLEGFTAKSAEDIGQFIAGR